MNYYPFHIGDYTAHTRNLSLLEDLAYRRMLDAYYLAERPLSGTASDVAREIGMRDHLPDVEYVLGKFFSLEDGLWRHARCDEVIARACEKSEQASRAGRASAARRSGTRSTPVESGATGVGNTETGVQPPNTQYPIPNTQKRKTSSVRSEDDPEFEAAWVAYPKRPGASKKDAHKAWKARINAGVDPAKILAGVQRYAAYCVANKTEPQFIKQPATFFGPGDHYLAEWTLPPPKPVKTTHDLTGMNYTQGARDDGSF